MEHDTYFCQCCEKHLDANKIQQEMVTGFCFDCYHTCMEEGSSLISESRRYEIDQRQTYFSLKRSGEL